MRNVCLLIFGVVASATALVTAYHIDPRTAAMSGKVSGNPDYGGVSEVLTCNYDSLSYVELFAGEKGAGGLYTVAVLEDGAQVMSSNGSQDYDCRWVRFENWDNHVAFTKGKRYEFKFTRSGSDSIQYYYQGGNPALSDPYSWGWMRVGGTEEVCMDLCARVYGHPKVGGQATAAA